MPNVSHALIGSVMTLSGYPIAAFPRVLGARGCREAELGRRPLKLQLEPAPTTVPAATEENQHYQDDDEEGGGVHVALPRRDAVNVQ